MNASRVALSELRDGDWKTTSAAEAAPSPAEAAAPAADDSWQEDTRIEGTIAYLPPEVIAGQRPTQAADSWALGCLL